MSAFSRCIVAALVFAAACARGDSRPARPRRIVLVVLDALRADHVGAYGCSRATTTHLDALARDGVVFERAYAASSFGPQALSALWTGCLPSRGGSTGIEAVPHSALRTLPQLFVRAGFRTALVSNDAELRERAFTRGFDELEVDSVSGRWSGELVTEKALDLVDGAAGAPLFLVIDYADASEPHQPPAEFRRRIDVPPAEEPLTLPALRARAGAFPEDIERSLGFQDLVARYDAEIAHVDACLGRFVDGLAERGLLEDTLLVVTASHGEEFLEHGYVGSGWTLYDEVLQVPLVVSAPSRLARGRIAEPVSLVDIVPSLKQICALGSGDAQLDGRTLFDLAGQRLVPRAPAGEAIAELVLPELCVLRASFRRNQKLVEVIQWAPAEKRAELLSSYEARLAQVRQGEAPPADPWGPVKRREVYDLADDPHETRNVIDSLPALLAPLAALLERYAESSLESGLAAQEIQRRTAASEPAALGELRQIGYL